MEKVKRGKFLIKEENFKESSITLTFVTPEKRIENDIEIIWTVEGVKILNRQLD